MVLTFTGAFALLTDLVLRDRKVSWRGFAIGLVVTGCLATPVMALQMTALQLLDGGVPGYLALGVGVGLYATVALLGRGRGTDLRPVDWLGLGAVASFLLMLGICMALFAPETHVSTGVHQQTGPCDARDTDITGASRQSFLCVEDYEEDFTFDCAEPPGHGARWYTICGKPHTDYLAYAAGTGALSLGGMIAFLLMFGGGGAGRRSAVEGAVPDGVAGSG